MPLPLIDLLWRDHHDAPTRQRRGPVSRVGTSEVVAVALDLADREGLPAVTVRALATALGIAPMSIYTHVNSRDDLLVLMADAAHAAVERVAHGRRGWRARVRQVAETHRATLLHRPWLLDIVDDRTALGPGTIAAYDHDLAAFDPMHLDDVTRDAALTLVLDTAASGARSARPNPGARELSTQWPEIAPRLGHYLGDSHPLAQRVGGAAGASKNGASHPDEAWRFAIERLLDGLAALDTRSGGRRG